MSTQKFSPSVIQAVVAEEMKCKPDSYTPLQGRLNSTLKYKDDLSWLSTIEHTSWKTMSTVKITRCCRICPNLSEQGPRCCWVSVLLQGPFLRPRGDLFCLPWPFGLMVATGQTSVGWAQGQHLKKNDNLRIWRPCCRGSSGRQSLQQGSPVSGDTTLATSSCVTSCV